MLILPEMSQLLVHKQNQILSPDVPNQNYKYGKVSIRWRFNLWLNFALPKDPSFIWEPIYLQTSKSTETVK